MMIRSTSAINLPVKNNFKIKNKVKIKVKIKRIIYKNQKDREIIMDVVMVMVKVIQNIMKFHKLINHLKKIKK